MLCKYLLSHKACLNKFKKLSWSIFCDHNVLKLIIKNFYNLITGMFEKIRLDVILNSKTLTLSLQDQEQIVYSVLGLSLNLFLVIIASVIRSEKDIEGIQVRKKDKNTGGFVVCLLVYY